MLLVLRVWGTHLGAVPRRTRIITFIEEMVFAGVMGYITYYLYSCRGWELPVVLIGTCSLALFPCIGLHGYVYSNARVFRKLSKQEFIPEYPVNILRALNSAHYTVLPSYTPRKFIRLFRRLRGTLGTHLLAYYALGWSVEQLAEFYGVSEEQEVATLYAAMGQLQSKRNQKRLWRSGIIQRDF